MAQKFIGITYPVRLGRTGMFEQSTTTIEQVRSNFKNLILTKKGERVQSPELGCDLWKVLFEPIDENIFENARAAVAEAVERWLPFIELTDFEITKTERDYILNIKCSYRFRNNPNVTDALSILTEELGLPSVVYSNDVISTTPKKTTASRIRRI